LDYVLRGEPGNHIPFRTEQNGTRGMLLMGGFKNEHIPHTLTALQRGEEVRLQKEVHITFKLIHRHFLTIEDRLYATATSIKKPAHPRHDGVRAYGVCWWNSALRTVWWSYASEDEQHVLRGTNPNVTSIDEIRAMFMRHQGVDVVRVVLEACPDWQKDGRWRQVYPD
jgi:hypothetical protein